MLIKSIIKKIVKVAIKGLLISSLAVGVVAGINLGEVEAHADCVSGQAIVDTAAQYIGKVPYVWGGNNIEGSNVGADCSGFICRIYEKFGYNFWPKRTSLRSYGENLGTDISVAKLGDIIWYSGHVAIFAGYNEKGEPTIIHETSGKNSNVVWTTHKWVNAELKGVIRIPGVDGDGSLSAQEAVEENPYLDVISENNSVAITEGWYTLTPECATALRLDVTGGSSEDVANMQVWGTNGTDAQKFYIKAVGNNYYQINTFAGKSIDVEGAVAQDGINIIQYTTHNGGNQRWYFVNAGNGYYYIVSAIGDNKYVMDVNGAGNEEGTNVHLWSINTSSAQKWKLEKVITQEDNTYSAKISIGNATWLRVRKKATALSKTVVFVRNNATVTVCSDKTVGNWSYIKIGDYQGYIQTKYLKRI